MYKYFFVLVCYFLCLEKAVAMKIIPFIHSFAPTREQGTIQYFLTNNSNETVAFEVSTLKRKQNANGDDILEKDNSFAVFPSQVIIPGGKNRSIKVKWVGNKDFEKNPNKEQAFRVLFDQFHIDFGKKRPKINKGASLEIKLRVLTSLYMTPESASKDIVIASVRESSSNRGKTYIVKVRNKGTAHCAAEEIDAEVTVFGKRYRLCDVFDKNSGGTILAESEREFIITEDSIKAGLQGKK